MAVPSISHEVDIHITATSGTALDSTNKLEETSTVTITVSATAQPRQNLNSVGVTDFAITWKEFSGSMDGRVVPTSTVQNTMRTAIEDSTSAFVHVIDNPTATTGQRKGYRYEVVFESYEETYAAADYVTFTAPFKANGAPVEILAA